MLSSFSILKVLHLCGRAGGHTLTHAHFFATRVTVTLSPVTYSLDFSSLRFI